MTANTGLLTSRCDPFGAESKIQLLGGMYDERHLGKHMWHCQEPATGRYRMTCTGGDYGHRRANDSGLIAAFHCPGGHQGQIMALCALHVAEFSSPGYARPRPLRSAAFDSAGHVQHWAPGSVVGGTRANGMCPRCMWPPETRAREAQDVADRLNEEIARLMMAERMTGILGLNARRIAHLMAAQDQIRALLDELFATGRIHKCPLRLVEVS